MRVLKFQDLEIWKLSIKITKRVYDFTARVRFSHDFALRDQLRRSIISISSNIVEGFEKNNNNEFVRFLRIAKGSAGEALNQLEISCIVGYITQEELESASEELKLLMRQIGSFISYLIKTKKLTNLKTYKQTR